MNNRLLVLLMALVAVIAPLERVLADDGGVGSSILRLQTKAEDLYASGHFERAHFIYVNELASRGDKYAQYMAGYMCLNGQGVDRDPVRASAWYRLAAERDIPEFSQARDQLLESMSDADRMRSDALYVELRQEYSDLVLSLGLVREERRKLGSGVARPRLPKPSPGPVTIVDSETGEVLSESVYLARAEARMQKRLDHITDSMGAERVDAGMSSADFETFSDQVRAFLAVVDDR